jgi:UDP-galactopyranose mutase
MYMAHTSCILQMKKYGGWFQSRFAEFNCYNHRLKSIVGNALYSYPINLMTLYQVFDVQTRRRRAPFLLLNVCTTVSRRTWSKRFLAMMGPTL